ncbi:MAG: hypothetical protein QXH80_00100 [Candidatus Nanoarchaeia archaeon]
MLNVPITLAEGQSVQDLEGKEFLLMNTKQIGGQKGDLVRVYLRGEKSFYVDVHIPRLFHTWPRSKDFLWRKEDELKSRASKYITSTEFLPATIENGVQKYTLRVQGQRELKKFLQKPFIESDSGDEQISWILPEYSKVKVENGLLVVKGPATLEEVLSLPRATWDNEAFKAGKDFYNTICSNNYLFKDPKNPKNDFERQISVFMTGLTHRDIAKDLSSSIKKTDPAIVGSHNFAYDSLQLRILTKKLMLSDVQPQIDNSILKKYENRISIAFLQAQAALPKLMEDWIAKRKQKKRKQETTMSPVTLMRKLGLNKEPKEVKDMVVYRFALADPYFLDWLNPLAEDFFTPGVDDTRPNIAATIVSGFSQEPEIAGRDLICTLAWARKHAPILKKTLECISGYRKIPYKKDVGDYDTLEDLCVRAARGDKKASATEQEYNAADNKVHMQLLESLFPVIAVERDAFETTFQAVCFHSQTNLAVTLGSKRHFFRFNFPRSLRRGLRDYDIYETKLRLLKSVGPQLDSQRGVFEEPLIVVYPKFLQVALENVLRNEPAYQKLNDAAKKFTNPQDKLVFLRDIDALCVEPVFNLSSNDEEYDVPYHVLFGKTRKEIRDNININVYRTKELLSVAGADVVNFDNRFLYLKPQDFTKAYEMLKKSDLFEIYGISQRTLSASPGRIIALIDDTVLTPGLDLEGRRGLRCYFEKDILEKIGEWAEGKLTIDELKGYCNQRFVALTQGKIPKEELFFEIRAGLDAEDYSYRARLQERVRFLIERSAKAGESLAFGYGIMDNSRKEYDLGMFMSDVVKVDVQKYQDKFFGVKEKGSKYRSFANSSLGDLLASVFPSSTDNDKIALMRCFNGDTLQQTLADFNYLF